MRLELTAEKRDYHGDKVVTISLRSQFFGKAKSHTVAGGRYFGPRHTLSTVRDSRWGKSTFLRNATLRARGAWHPWPPGPLTTVNSTTCNHISVYGSKERQIMVANGWPVGPHSLIIL